MKLFRMDRRKGKTRRLIKESSSTGAIIICRESSLKYIEITAKEMGLEIPKPMTIKEYKETFLKGYNLEEKHYDNPPVLVDEIDIALSMYLKAEILYATTSCEIDISTNFEINIPESDIM